MTKRRLPHRRLSKLWAATDGVAAIEFALIAPFLLFMFLASTDLSLALTVQRRIGYLASTVGDEISRQSTLSSTEEADVWTIGPTLLAPFSSSPNVLSERITSIQLTSATTATVQWCRVLPSSGYTQTAAGTIVTVTSGLGNVGDTLIKSEAEYSYPPLFGLLNFATQTLSATYYFKPRTATAVILGNGA